MDIKSILQRLGVYLEHIKRGWIVILICGMVLAILLLANSMLKPTFYQAYTTFHPETGKQEGEGMSPINLLFGSQAGGGSNQFMMGILKSRNLSEQVVSDTVEIDGERRLLADLIIESLPNYSSLVSFFQYSVNGAPTEKSHRVKVIQAASYIRSSLAIKNTEEGFIQLGISAYESRLSGIISESYIEQLGIYYSKRKTEKAGRNVRFFSFRADSVKNELDKINRRIANYVDKSRYKIYARDEIFPVDLENQQAILSQIYSSLVISREQALAQLQENIPVIQVLDPPMPPYRSISSKKYLYATIGLLAGVFIGVFLVTRQLLWEDITTIVRQALKLDEEDEKSEELEQEDDLA
ncbi:MAG: hypothetical protein MRZ79_12705 [Bacteroidia bacterium]|nr:hypothetical protein [Bacteroidia bacterium]